MTASLDVGKGRANYAVAATGRPTQGYLATLDGWRALAILAVIQFHDSTHRIASISSRLIHENGSLGVDLFFSISGFLICSRLLEESHKRGYISLKGFYIRRCFRILPAAWIYLIVCATLSQANIIPRDWGGLLASFLMVRNFWIAHAGDTPTHWYTIHFWSLSVEEHFYLLLPGMLVFAGRKKLKVLATASVLTTAWTLIIYRIVSLQVPAVWLRTDERLSSLMVPAFFAVLLREEKVRRFVIRRLYPWVAFLVLALVHLAGNFIRTLQPLVIIYGFPLVIISTVYHPSSWSGKVLELPPLKFVGRLSYSLYLWQQLFFLFGHQRANPWLSTFQYFPLNYLAAFVLAIASYYFLEKPFIRLGHKIAHPPSEGRGDLVTIAKEA